MTPSLQCLTEVYDRIEAEMIKAALEAAGIPAMLSQEAAGSLYPLTFGELARIEILVPQTYLGQARQWLAEYEQGKEESDTMIDEDTP